MITEHAKFVKKHLGFKEGEEVSKELDDFISGAEKMLISGCCKNNFQREVIVAMLAMLKHFGSEAMLAPVAPKKDEPKPKKQKYAIDETVAKKGDK